jgi:hypothetical protein
MAKAKETGQTETDFIPPAAAKRKRPIGNQPVGRESTNVQPDIADADKVARTGTKDEQVRDTPPAGDWNDVA